MYVHVSIQFLCWGVRNLKRFRGLRVNPLVEVECGNYPIQIPPPRVINDKKNANFPKKLFTFDVVRIATAKILHSIFFILYSFK